MKRIDIFERAGSYFNINIPSVEVKNYPLTVNGGRFHEESKYYPLKEAFESLCRSNAELANYKDKVQALLYPERNKLRFNPPEHEKKPIVEKLTKEALALFKKEKLLFLEYTPPKRSPILVIPDKFIYDCDRAQDIGNSIARFPLRPGKTIDEAFLNEFWLPETQNNKVPDLVSIWSIFHVLGIDHSVYHQMTSLAQESIWRKLNAEPVANGLDLTSILLFSWLKSRAEVLNMEKVSIEDMSDSKRNQLLLNVRLEFFAPYYRAGFYQKNSLKKESCLAKQKKYFDPLYCNGGRAIDDILKEKYPNMHVYFKVLFICLRHQGKGIEMYRKELMGDKDKLKEFRKFAKTRDFNLPAALVTGANGFRAVIDAKDFAMGWELTFGTDWRDLQTTLLTDHSVITDVNIVFGKYEDVWNAKAIMYGSLLCSYTKKASEKFPRDSMDFISLKPELLTAFPDLSYVKGVFNADYKTPFHFPFQDKSNIASKYKQISNVIEFMKKVEELMEKLVSNDFSPIMKVIKADGSLAQQRLFFFKRPHQIRRLMSILQLVEPDEKKWNPPLLTEFTSIQKAVKYLSNVASKLH